MNTTGNKIPDFVKALLGVPVIYIVIVVMATVLEFLLLLFLRVTGTLNPLLVKSLPELANSIAAIAAAVVAIKALAEFNLFARFLGGSLAGFITTSMVMHGKNVTTSNLVVGMAIAALGAMASHSKKTDSGSSSMPNTSPSPKIPVRSAAPGA